MKRIFNYYLVVTIVRFINNNDNNKNMVSYKPTTREVLDELIGKPVRNGIEGVKDFTVGYLKGLGSVVVAPHIIPTAIRVYNQRERNPNLMKKTGSKAGKVTGALIDLVQLGIYVHAVRDYGYKGLLPLIATNLGSLGYESYRAAKQRVIDRH